MTARLSASALGLEAFVAFFGTLAVFGTPTGRQHAGLVWGIGLGLTVLCVLAAGMARQRSGLYVAVFVQAVLLAASTQVFAGFVIALVFAALWAWLVWIGMKIDRDRAVRSASRA